jgi:hypothetical protein
LSYFLKGVATRACMIAMANDRNKTCTVLWYNSMRRIAMYRLVTMTLGCVGYCIAIPVATIPLGISFKPTRLRWERGCDRRIKTMSDWKLHHWCAASMNVEVLFRHAEALIKRDYMTIWRYAIIPTL